MPLLFSYGTLQQETVQVSTFGRKLDGRRDELIGFASSSVTIGETLHANVEFNDDTGSRMPGTVFEITDAELDSADAYEIAFSYKRIPAKLASGSHAWVYVHASQ